MEIVVTCSLLTYRVLYPCMATIVTVLITQVQERPEIRLGFAPHHLCSCGSGSTLVRSVLLSVHLAHSRRSIDSVLEHSEGTACGWEDGMGSVDQHSICK